MTKKLVLFLFFLFLVSSAFALDIPKPAGYVNDYANIISPDFELKINNLISEIEKNTTVEIAIVTIPSLDGEDIFSFSLKLAREWGVGKKNNNGLVFLSAIKDRRNRFEVGKGLEGTLPDILTDDLRREFITPYFRAERYGEGIYLMLEEVYKILQNDPSIIAKHSSKNSLRQYEGFFVFFLLMYFIIFSAVISEKVKNLKKKYSYLSIITFLGIFIGTIIGIGLVVSIMLAFFGFIASTRARTISSGGVGGHWGGSGGGFSGGGGFGGGGFGGGGSSGGW
ncbi:MAG: TPM domain-containing protein [Nanoarchaeota archaeon]